MTDEIQDAFERLRELAKDIYNNIGENHAELAKKQARLLIANLDVIEAQIKFDETL